MKTHFCGICGGLYGFGGIVSKCALGCAGLLVMDGWPENGSNALTYVPGS